MVSKGFVDVGSMVQDRHHHPRLVEWYSKVFQHDQSLQLGFVLMIKIRMVACQGDLWLLDDRFFAGRLHPPFATSVVVHLFPHDHGGLVAR